MSNTTVPPSVSWIAAELLGPEARVWEEVRDRAAAAAYCEYLTSTIDFHAGHPSDRWDRIGTYVFRDSLLHGSFSFRDRIAEMLSEDHEAIFTKVLTAHGLKSLGAKQLRKSADAVAGLLIQHVSVAVASVTDPVPALWAVLGNYLATGVAVEMHERASAPDVENRLLLAHYFTWCRLTNPISVRQYLTSAATSLIGLRGTLVSIPNAISIDGLTDKPPDIVGLPSLNRRLPRHRAPLVDLVCDEVALIRQTAGCMHRLLNPQAPVTIAGGVASPAAGSPIVGFRTSKYTEYEETLGAYLALSATEFLLRCLGERCNVAHLSSAGVPKSVDRWLHRLPLNAAVTSLVGALYNKGSMGLRHKVSHCAVMELAAREMETVYASDERLRHLIADLTTPVSASNLHHLALRAMLAVEEAVVSTRGTHLNTAWTRQLRLTPSEVSLGVSFAERLETSPDRLEAINWSQGMTDFLLALCPGLSQLFNLGYNSWLRAFRLDESWTGLASLGLVFEGVYRCACKLAGLDVLQVRPGAEESVDCEYRMLDSGLGGLCHDSVLDAFLLHAGEHAVGPLRRIIMAAVRIRNAIAHGAVLTLSRSEQIAYGGTLVQAVDVLRQGSLFHLRRRLAYYRWVDSRHRVHGYDVDDWIWAGSRVQALVDELVSFRKSTRIAG